MRKLILGVAFVMFAFQGVVWATICYPAVNHITKQRMTLETGGLYQPIGWSACPERDPDLGVRLGYTPTSFAYAIESVIIASICVIGLITGCIVGRRMKRLPTTG